MRIQRREAELGLVRKEIDLQGRAFYAGGGEIDLAPVWFDMPGQDSGERAARLAKAKRSGRGDSAAFALLESFARAYKEPMLYIWRGPYMDVENAERLDDHPATRPGGLLRAPNTLARMTMTSIKPALSKAKKAAGNFYIIKARTGGGSVFDNTTGAVARLWPGWSVRIKPAVYTDKDGKTSNGWIDYYEYKPDRGRPRRIPPENIIHFRNGMRDDEPRLGVGVVEEIVIELGLDIDATLLTAAVMSNLGVPGLVFSPEQPPNLGAAVASASSSAISADDRAEIKAAIIAKTTGSRRGEPIVFSRPTRFEQFEVDLAQYDLDHVWRHVETRMSGVLGWPAILAGLGAGLDSAHYNNVSTLLRHATEGVLVPEWRDDSETWDSGLRDDLGLSDDEWIAYDWRGVRALQEGRDALWTRVGREWERGALTIGQHHRLLDLELPAGVDPDLRKAEIEASAQLSGLLGPAFGKSRSFIVDGSGIRPALLTLRAGAAGNGHGKALPLPAAVTIGEDDVEDAARDWDKWAAKYAPDYVGIMDAEVVEEEEG